MLPIVWSKDAELDLLEILEFVAERNPIAALKLSNTLLECVIPLSEHPYIFKPSERFSGYREIVAHPNYIVIYKVETHQIVVMQIVHSRQKFP